MKHTALTALILVAAALPAFAGEVILTNGDRLTGTLDTIVGGKLQLRSPLLGVVEIDMIHVASVSSDETVTVVLSDGRTVVRRLRAAAPSRVQLRDEQDRIDQEVDFEQIEAISPPPQEAPKRTGSLSGSLTSIHGNTRSQSVQAGISMAKRLEDARTTLGADYGRSTRRNANTGNDDTTEDWWRLSAKYDRFFSQKFYGYLEGRYAVDKVARLDRRIIGGIGGGYQWIESDTLNVATEAGLAHITEAYKDNGTDDRLSASAGYNLDAKINSRLSFRHNLTYFPSLEKFSDYYLSTSAELRAKLTDNMFTNFRAIFDYDATPATGQTKTDTKYLLGVGWEF